MISITTVEYITIGIIGFLIVFNILLNFNKVENDTVNTILKKWASGRYFFITFAWGVLGGHFFLGTRTAVFGSNWWIPVVLVIAIIVGLFILGEKLKPTHIKSRYQFLLLLTGVAYGHFIWSQRHIPTIDFPW